jgi:Effector-associated domain 1/TIR domain/CHAT domain
MTTSNTTPQTILFLAANPKETPPLQLDKEFHDIAEGLQRSQIREKFNLEQRLAVRPRDIQLAMLDLEPQIVHFSGHGAGETGLILEDESGNIKLVNSDALAGIFELFADQLNCVVLNACYSEIQARIIAEHIPYVIGMNKAIGDKAAIIFAVGFYDALSAGRDVEFAFRLGCAAIRLDGSAEHITPVLIKKPVGSGAAIFVTPNSQPITSNTLELKETEPALTTPTTREVNMELSGDRIKQLREALQGAFPSRDKLKLLVNEEFNEKFDEIVGDGPLPKIVGELIDFAEAEGRLVELVSAAIRRNPGNPKLRLFAQSVGLLSSELKSVTSTTNGIEVSATPTLSQTEPNPKTSTTPVPLEPIEIFISYSHKDDELREELVIHLSNLRRQGKISAWHDRAIEAGAEWETQIKSRLESAQIILLLISPPFMASNYCYDIEMQRAVQRHDQGNARVIPIILRPVDWKDSPISKLQALPKDAKPITQWGDRDAAFVDVVQGIRRAVDSLTNK